MMKKGFTIVELLMVIAIIAVLMGVVTTAASSSIKMSRVRKAQTLCTVVQAGLATYYAQKEKWPVSSLGNFKRSNNSGVNGSSDDDQVVLNATEVRTCVRALVDEAKAGNPVMDISGLYVSRSQGERNTGAAYGCDFFQAVSIRGMQQAKGKSLKVTGGKRLKVAELYFGYPESEHGWFRRFNMTYSLAGDMISVSQQAAETR